MWGIYSNSSLGDSTVYPDDVIVHGSDYAPDGADNLGYFRRMDSLVDTTDMNGNCSEAQPGVGKVSLEIGWESGRANQKTRRRARRKIRQKATLPVLTHAAPTD